MNKMNKMNEGEKKKKRREEEEKMRRGRKIFGPVAESMGGWRRGKEEGAPGEEVRRSNLQQAGAIWDEIKRINDEKTEREK